MPKKKRLPAKVRRAIMKVIRETLDQTKEETEKAIREAYPKIKEGSLRAYLLVKLRIKNGEFPERNDKSTQSQTEHTVLVEPAKIEEEEDMGNIQEQIDKLNETIAKLQRPVEQPPEEPVAQETPVAPVVAEAPLAAPVVPEAPPAPRTVPEVDALKDGIEKLTETMTSFAVNTAVSRKAITRRMERIESTLQTSVPNVLDKLVGTIRDRMPEDFCKNNSELCAILPELKQLQQPHARSMDEMLKCPGCTDKMLAKVLTFLKSADLSKFSPEIQEGLIALGIAIEVKQEEEEKVDGKENEVSEGRTEPEQSPGGLGGDAGGTGSPAGAGTSPEPAPALELEPEPPASGDSAPAPVVERELEPEQPTAPEPDRELEPTAESGDIPPAPEGQGSAGSPDNADDADAGGFFASFGK